MSQNGPPLAQQLHHLLSGPRALPLSGLTAPRQALLPHGLHPHGARLLLRLALPQHGLHHLQAQALLHGAASILHQLHHHGQRLQAQLGLQVLAQHRHLQLAALARGE